MELITENDFGSISEVNQAAFNFIAKFTYTLYLRLEESANNIRTYPSYRLSVHKYRVKAKSKYGGHIFTSVFVDEVAHVLLDYLLKG